MSALRIALAVGTLLGLPSLGSSGMVGSPLPMFSDGQAAELVGLVPSAVKNNDVETVVVCSNLDAVAVNIGLEVFDKTGAIGNSIVGDNGALLNVAVGATVTIATSATAVFATDAILAMEPNLRNGSARIVATSRHVRCIAMLVDELHSIVAPVVGTPPPTVMSAPVWQCGNAILDPFEECDDGNVAGADGCDAACLVEVAATPTATSTATPSATSTLTPSTTSTPMPTSTLTATATPSATGTPTVTSTATPSATATPTVTATATLSATATPSATERPTTTLTATPIPTSTSAGTATPAPTSIPTPAASPTPGGIPSHFQCHALRREPFRRIEGLTLEDPIGVGTVDIVRPRRLCNPASKNDEDPAALLSSTHLVGYQIKHTPRQRRLRGVRITNQLGGLTLELHRPDLLLVPSGESLERPPPLADPTVDHFKCYRVRRARARLDGILVEDQFGRRTVAITRPLRLCLAANKNAEGVRNPGGHLMCYQIRVARGSRFRSPASVFTNDQLGALTLAPRRPVELCLPTTVALP